MLLAEIHRKRVHEARASEDYLTSAAFGHLRYVPHAVFWPDLFAAAVTADGRITLLQALRWSGADPADAGRLDAAFWPTWNTGEPDLVLTFRFPDGRTAVVIVEVKLWSGKSGVDDRDQLVRYLRGSDAAGVPALLVYLTPRDPFADLQDSLRSPGARAGYEFRLFGLRWQTLQDVARRAAHQALPPFGQVLADVATFLDEMGLAGFDGWKRPPVEITPARARWVTPFQVLADLPALIPTPARWIHGP